MAKVQRTNKQRNQGSKSSTPVRCAPLPKSFDMPVSDKAIKKPKHKKGLREEVELND